MTTMMAARREASPTTNDRRTRRLSRIAYLPQKPLYQAVSAPLPHSGRARAAMCFCIKDGVFLDPAFGTGSFFSALVDHSDSFIIEKATGIEIDSHYAIPAKKLWGNTVLDIEIGDFTILLPEKNIISLYAILPMSDTI
jgi:DNA modification methylase